MNKNRQRIFELTKQMTTLKLKFCLNDYTDKENNGSIEKSKQLFYNEIRKIKCEISQLKGDKK